MAVAPYVLGQYLFGSHFKVAVSPTDAAATTLAMIGDSVWSDDIVQAGFHFSDLSGLGGGNMFAFSGGCYMAGRKKWCLPGGGGHSDSANTGIAVLDLAKAKWSTTELSAMYRGDGVPDPTNPCTNGERVFKSWPNSDGERAPMAGHRYSAPEWMPEIGFGFSYGSFSYNSGTGCRGYYLFAGNGKHDQTKGFAGGLSGGTLMTLWVPGIKRLWGTNAGNSYASHMDPLTSVVTQTHRFDVHDTFPDLYLQGPGCLIPDPYNHGDSAFVYWDSVGSVSKSGERICYAPKVGSGATGQLALPISFGNAVPAGLSMKANGAHNSAWFDFAGKYKSGSTKILVWDWGSSSDGYHADRSGTGLYLLDISSWRWSGPLAGSAQPYPGVIGASYGFKCVFVASDYLNEKSYLPIGLVQPYNPATGKNGGELRFYKIPWALL